MRSRISGYLRIQEAAEFVGVSAMTLRRWDRSGKLPAHRNPMNNYRLYRKSQLRTVLKAIRRHPTRR